MILGNMNAITYKEVFPHLKDNEIWLGYKSLNQDMYFDVPEERRQWLLANKKEGSAYKIIDGVVMGRLASACWFANLDHGKRHELLLLDTMEHNLKFNKKLRKKFEKDFGANEYPHYDNYDAIGCRLQNVSHLIMTARWGCLLLFWINTTLFNLRFWIQQSAGQT